MKHMFLPSLWKRSSCSKVSRL